MTVKCLSKAAIPFQGREEVIQCDRLAGHASSVPHWNMQYAHKWPNDHFLTNQPDMVNHPPHYKANPSGVECIQVVEHMTFNAGNAIKYIWRHLDKGTPIEDLEKARWYLNREIDRLANLSASGE